MSRATKRRITVSLLAFAGVTVLVALSLAAVNKHVSEPGPDEPVPVASSSSDVTTTPTSVVSVKVEPATPDRPDRPAPPPEPKQPEEPPKVDVVFVLDTTGSMSGLIAGAKRKIWSIANQILSGQPRPHVRIGLIGYRDRGDDYVTRRYQLTEDIDDVHRRLRRFRANGGGDTPEHVNRALAEAIRRMKWRKGQNVLRQIYLVGDAPPHEGRDGLTSATLAREAGRKGIMVNAVRCGTMGATARKWKAIASASGGMYASIRQDGAMVALSTPHDRRLKELNEALSRTLLATGSSADKSAARGRARANMHMDAYAQAESAGYRATSGRLDSKDLLTVMKRGKKLDDLRDEELPAPVAALPKPARKRYVAKVKAKRAKIMTEIKRVNRARRAYLKKKRPRSGPKAFDDTVREALKAQGKRAGLAY